jgi:hypothetical protein
MADIEILLVSLIMGVINPPAVATATETSILGRYWMVSSPDNHMALHSGTSYIKSIS